MATKKTTPGPAKSAAKSVGKKAAGKKAGAAKTAPSVPPPLPPIDDQPLTSVGVSDEAAVAELLGGGGDFAALAVAPSAPPTAQQVDMDTFFQGVANSLISAQKQLDVQSAEYLKATSGSKFLLPSVFRIPKLSAELKFAVNNATASGVNLLIFKNQTTAQTSNEQSVQFDIVAAPPPPELMRSPITVGLVFDKTRRTNILSGILPPPWGTSPELVVIYEILPGRFLAAFASDAIGQVAMWFIADDPSKPIVIRAFGGGAESEPLRLAIRQLGNDQKNFVQK